MKMLIRTGVVLSVLSVAAVPVLASPIVLNGGFETGTFAGWTTTPGPVSLLYVGTANPHSGAYSAVFGGMNFGLFMEDTISQSLATTPGQSYVVDFWLTEQTSGCDPLIRFCRANDFNVFWNGDWILGLISMDPFGYTKFSLNVLATGATSTLSFAAADEPGYYRLDDIRIDAVPEPASLLLLGGGLAGWVAGRRRRN